MPMFLMGTGLSLKCIATKRSGLCHVFCHRISFSLLKFFKNKSLYEFHSDYTVHKSRLQYPVRLRWASLCLCRPCGLFVGSWLSLVIIFKACLLLLSLWAVPGLSSLPVTSLSRVCRIQFASEVERS